MCARLYTNGNIKYVRSAAALGMKDTERKNDRPGAGGRSDIGSLRHGAITRGHSQAFPRVSWVT